MSYILEALKKSEQERQRGKVPDLQTIQEELPEEAARQKIWPYLLAAGVIALNIAAFIFLPKSPQDDRLAETKVITTLPVIEVKVKPPVEPAKQVSRDRAEESPSAPAPIISTNPTTKQAPVQPAPQPAPVKIVSAVKPEKPEKPEKPQPVIRPEKTNTPPLAPTVVVPKKVQAKAANKTVQSEKIAPQITPPPQQKSVAVQRKTAVIPAGRPSVSVRKRNSRPKKAATDLDWLKESETARLNKKKIFSLAELPDSIRSDLPDFNISAHFYSHNPRGRMLSLNGSIVRQGQTISQGLRLDEITEDGAVFKYRGIRFKVDVF